MSKQRCFAWLILILLAASFLRLHQLPQIPPGMTHDEADHGLDAWGVVQGIRPLYFTVGYGREPLFDYSTAVLMTFLGPTYLAGRLTAVFYSLLFIAGNFAWIRRALDERHALFAAAGLAVSFWPVMTARQALRSITLPALFVLAAYFFWRGIRTPSGQAKRNGDSLLRHPHWAPNFLPAGALLGLTFYSYIPARVLWLAFPALLLFLMWAGHSVPWRGLALTLVLAGAIALPLFVHLYRYPQAEVRIDELAEPLRLARDGNVGPLLANIKGALGIFSLRGDDSWRYNLAGRPLFGPVMSILFYVGIILAVWHALSFLGRRGAHDDYAAPGLFFSLVWLLLGLSPVLVTGPDLSTTQAIGMQPVLYLFPAVALFAVADRFKIEQVPWLLPTVVVLLFALLFGGTVRAYFYDWATRPEVAIQYEAELVETIRYLNQQGRGPAAISSDAPNRFHDPATAQLFLSNPAVSLRWFDGRHALLLPQEDNSLLLFTDDTRLHPGLKKYLQPLSVTPISTGPSAEGYKLSAHVSTFERLYPQFSREIANLSTELSTEIYFSSSARFLGYALSTTNVRPGETIQLATLWQIQEQPQQALVLFTHVLAPDGKPVAQVDRLDVPSVFWHPGDIFIQMHDVALPPGMLGGTYPLTVGLYPANNSQQRLPIQIDGTVVGDVLHLPPLTVTP